MTTKTPTAQQALDAATTIHEQASTAITAAQSKVAAAEQTLAEAKSRAIEVARSKCADASEARQAIETARAAIKEVEDELDFANLELQAAEIVQRQAYDEQMAAKRRVIADQYKAEHKRYNDPQCREAVLLTQLSDVVRELFPLVWERKDLHDRLYSEYWHLPEDERPSIPAGARPIMPYSTRAIFVHPFGQMPQEVVEAIRAGNAAGQVELEKRQRARLGQLGH